MYPYEDELPEEDSWDAFVAGTAPLPPYVYTGDDPIEAAAAAYTAQMGLSFLVPENAAAIPAPVILKTERPDDETALLYGNFWVFNYVLNGPALHCASGGDAPGVMTLKNTEAGWEVTSFEAAGEGEDFSRDIRRFCQGDEALEEAYYASQDAAQDPLKSVRQKFIQDYVTASGLDVTAYQDYGWNPVKLFPRENSVTVTAIASEINPEQLASVAVYARITAYSPEKNELTVEVIVPETYDRDEVLDLQIGDSIYTQGQEITVETLGEKYGYLVINEGDYEFSEGSVWLYEQFDGTFAIADWHDNTWAILAELHIPAGAALLFLDSIDPATGEILNMPSVHGAAEFLEMLQTETEEGGPGFATNNVYAVFDGAGQLAVIERYYVPWQ
jgi:hypothetical protein